MGSLWGHIDEGIVFLGLAIWWMINMLRDYIKIGGKDDFRPPMSYTTHIRGKEIPIEIYLKIFFSVGGFLIELLKGGPDLYDVDGNFRKVTGLQHMSIFALFFTHSILDLLRYFKVLYIEGLDHLTLAFAFIWYGIIFIFHTQYNSDDLETIVHTMGLLWCFGTGISVLWEYRSTEKFVPCYCKVLMMMGLGTWFVHVPFFLFSTDSFPGENMNPRWDRENKENYQVVASLFGVHLCFNTIFSIVVYAVLRCFVKGRDHRESIKFRRIPNGDIEQLDEKEKLMSEEEL